MSSIIENLQLAAQQVHLINLYQANSEVVYTGYIDRLAPDGVVVNTYDDAGLQDGAVFMRYDVIDEVEMMSEDLDNMAFRLKNATTEGLNSVPQPALAIDDQQPALAQLVDHAHSDHQVVLLVLADNDNYLEGQVQAITDQTITFTTFDKFDFKNKT
ncbi:hypothetical protein ACQXW1_02065 [Lactiplantibacillus pentosus]